MVAGSFRCKFLGSVPVAAAQLSNAMWNMFGEQVISTAFPRIKALKKKGTDVTLTCSRGGISFHINLSIDLPIYQSISIYLCVHLYLQGICIHFWFNNCVHGCGAPSLSCNTKVFVSLKTRQKTIRRGLCLRMSRYRKLSLRAWTQLTRNVLLTSHTTVVWV